MENMQYAEELVREFLVFRGFTNTLQAFNAELNTDVGKAFQVEKLLDLIFSNYIPKFQSEKLVDLLSFFKQCLSSYETEFYATLSKLEVSIFRYYIVHAVRSGRNDKVLEFFGRLGQELRQKGDNWSPWFVIPYLKNPSTDPQFCIYFSKEWFDALYLSIRNFLSQMFSGTRIPALLKISTEKNTVKHLRRDINQLNLKLSQLQAVLEEREAQLQQFRSDAVSMRQEGRSAHNDTMTSTASISSKDFCENPATTYSRTETGIKAHDAIGSSSHCLDDGSNSSENQPVRDSHISETHQFSTNGLYDGGKAALVLGEEEFSEVKIQFQETFLGHTSSITRSRFSASGNNIASASVDGTVRIWTHDSSMPGSRNATIYCGAEILSLDWDCKSDRLLLIGTAEGGIKAWNVDAKRVVCDCSTGQTFRRVLDVKCSPVEPIFVSAAASEGDGTSYANTSGFASLTVWNMKTWRAMFFLLGKNPQP